MAQIASIFYPDCEYPNFSFSNSKNNKSISEDCFIHEDSKIGNNCIIGSFVKIGPGVKIGSNCIIGDNVSIYYSIISDNVKIYNGVKIGGEGFGFISDNTYFKKIPQLGRVIIEENVEIGSNSTVDRGSIGDTIISKNVMIDNLVHVAHNVKIGKNTIIAAMTGISGSCEIGSNSMIGGQVGISGHLKIGNNVKIAAKSGVMKDIPDNSSVGGYPAFNIIDWHRSTILNNKKRK
jgi:UDP-3-O-[3-hydroxymyristoyl] glucosamine N-acyltransferase